MVGEKKRCDNCWVWVEKDLSTCPNCSHPFPVDDPAKPDVVRPKIVQSSPFQPLRTKNRPFKFILLFLLSFITILTFMAAEGMRLNGSQDVKYLFGDVIWVSLVALLMAVVFMFIDYMVGE